MTRRIDFEPMSITAIGGPCSSRPFADAVILGDRLRPFDEAAYKAARRRFLERFSTSGQARIRHEILMGVEEFLARGGLYARRTAIRQELPALFVILEIGNHDLAKDLLVHRGIEHRTQDLDPAIEIARHHIGRGNINGGSGMRQRMAGTETVDA